MNPAEEQRHLLAQAAEKVLEKLGAYQLGPTRLEAIRQGRLDREGWTLLEEAGLPALLVAENSGGYGGGWEDACIVLRLAGRHAVPMPLAETLLAGKLLSDAGIATPAGAIAVAPCAELDLQAAGSEVHCRARLLQVGWGNAAEHVVAVGTVGGERTLVLLHTGEDAAINPTATMAGEPVADLQFNRARVLARASAAGSAFHWLALTRVLLMAGALEALTQQSVRHANERSQFGKSIGKFQAIQHMLAILASEAAAVRCAAQAACRAANGRPAHFEIAAAKLRANRAVGTATAIAHQVHGAIGFTREHALQLTTRRLWVWRSECGNDSHWAACLGQQIARRGSEHFWSDLTATT